MQIASTDRSDSGDIDGEAGEGKRIHNIAEFKLSSGILSFSIVNATMRRVKSSIESYYPFEEPEDFDEDNNSTYALVLHMFVVQAKSLQECQIIYQPCMAAAENAERRSLSSSKRSETPDDSLVIKQDSESPGSGNALDSLFAKSAKRASTSSSSAVVAVAAAAAAAPSAILQEAVANKEASKSESPQFGSAYPQVNLMTPDAFSASGTTTATAVVVATTSTTSAAGDGSSTGGATTESIDSAVLNTLRMLATVTAKTVENSKPNLLNLMNNTLIEDREQQKMKKLEARKNFIAIDRNPERNLAENLASGGSSPSREVQEIMATQEDVDSYEAELENLEDDDDDEEELANSSPLLEAVDGTWPMVKLPLTNSAELQNAAQIMSQVVQNTNNGNVPPTLGGGSINSGNNGNNSAIVGNNNTSNNTASTLNTSNSSSENTAISGAGEGANGNGELSSKIEQLIGKIIELIHWKNIILILILQIW